MLLTKIKRNILYFISNLIYNKLVRDDLKWNFFCFFHDKFPLKKYLTATIKPRITNYNY